jgi:hypothetical protein
MQIALKRQAVARLEKVCAELNKKYEAEQGADDDSSFFDALPVKSATEVAVPDTHTVVSSQEGPTSEMPQNDSPLSDI